MHQWASYGAPWANFKIARVSGVTSQKYSTPPVPLAIPELAAAYTVRRIGPLGRQACRRRLSELIDLQLLERRHGCG
jgi:hypothetical protein